MCDFRGWRPRVVAARKASGSLGTSSSLRTGKSRSNERETREGENKAANRSWGGLVATALGHVSYELSPWRVQTHENLLLYVCAHVVTQQTVVDEARQKTRDGSREWVRE